MATITINNANLNFHKSIASRILSNAMCRTTGLDSVNGYTVLEVPYVQGMSISMRVNGASCAGITYWDRQIDSTPSELTTTGFLGYDQAAKGGSSAVNVENHTPSSVPEGTAYIYLSFMQDKRKYVRVD